MICTLNVIVGLNVENGYFRKGQITLKITKRYFFFNKKIKMLFLTKKEEKIAKFMLVIYVISYTLG